MNKEHKLKKYIESLKSRIEVLDSECGGGTDDNDENEYDNLKKLLNIIDKTYGTTLYKFMDLVHEGNEWYIFDGALHVNSSYHDNWKKEQGQYIYESHLDTIKALIDITTSYKDLNEYLIAIIEL